MVLLPYRCPWLPTLGRWTSRRSCCTRAATDTWRPHRSLRPPDHRRTLNPATVDGFASADFSTIVPEAIDHWSSIERCRGAPRAPSMAGEGAHSENRS